MLAASRLSLHEPLSPTAAEEVLASPHDTRGDTVSAYPDADLLPPLPELPLEFDLMAPDHDTRALSIEALLGAHKLAERAQEAQEAAAAAQEREREHHRDMERRRQEAQERQAEHDRIREREADKHQHELSAAAAQAELDRRTKSREQFGWLLLAVTLIAFTGAGIRFRGQWLGLEVSGDAVPTPTVDARPPRREEETEP